MQSYRQILENISTILVGISAAVAINVFPLKNTIAARNISLFVGALAAIYLLYIWRKKIDHFFYLPLALMACVAPWQALHAFFAEVATDIHFQELSSLWLRSLAALILGSGAGVLIANSKKRNLALFILMIIPIFSFLKFGINLIETNKFKYPLFTGLYITKASATYFLSITYFFLIGYIYSVLKSGFKINNLHLLYYVICIILIFINIVSVDSLSGILIMMVFLILFILVNANKLLNKKYILIILTFSSLIFFQISDNVKIKTLFQDISVGVQINKYKNWQMTPENYGVPEVNGRIVMASTYYRVASAINGLKLVMENPLGAGFTYLPYGYYMSKSYPNSRADHTHSGWIDLALGVGIPGIALIFSSFYMFITAELKRKSFKKNHFNKGIIIWTLSGLIFIWIFLEVSEKEYIEYLYFIVGFLYSIDSMRLTE